MGRKCDFRALARDQADTPRQRTLVDELLKGGRVFTVEGQDGYLRVGMAGLHWSYWERLRERLVRLGFQLQGTTENGRLVIRMEFPCDD